MILLGISFFEKKNEYKMYARNKKGSNRGSRMSLTNPVHAEKGKLLFF